MPSKHSGLVMGSQDKVMIHVGLNNFNSLAKRHIILAIRLLLDAFKKALYYIKISLFEQLILF